MPRFRRRLSAALGRMLALSGLLFGAVAAPAAASDGWSARSIGGAMPEGREVIGPRAFYALCEREPWNCPTVALSAPPRAAPLDSRRWAELTRINDDINAAHPPATDTETYNVSDFWTLPSHAADCEDYALAKRAALIEAGWPAEALLIGVVRGRLSPYHAVLVVATEAGDFVLDNLETEVLGWRETGYEWVVRQSHADPARWVMVETPDAAVPAAPRVESAEARR